MSRTTDLWAAAAEALEDGCDPFSLDFLVAHDVTADECFDLGAAMAAGLRVLGGLIDYQEARRKFLRRDEEPTR